MTAKKPSRKPVKSIRADYSTMLTSVIDLLEAAKRTAVRSVNAVMTTTYWSIGQRIVKQEQRGAERADYGEELIGRLAADLTARFGRGFSRSNLFQMRAFYLAYTEQGGRTARVSPQRAQKKIQTVSGQSGQVHLLEKLSARFPLPWSHYVRLLSVKKTDARAFYEMEALRGDWTIRQLDRQINSQFYERTLLSKNKAAMLEKAQQHRPQDAVTPKEEIKDPFVLEFLDLKDEYSESDLETALIAKLENFLLELDDDFTFVGRQRRLRIDDEWYRIDLLFFHRRLRCLVVVDLKLGKLTHADAGQMHLYLNYARQNWTLPGENPPVGLILCADKGKAMAHYALEGLPNKVLAAEYKTTLPTEAQLAAELTTTKNLLKGRTQRSPYSQFIP